MSSFKCTGCGQFTNHWTSEFLCLQCSAKKAKGLTLDQLGAAVAGIPEPTHYLGVPIHFGPCPPYDFHDDHG